MEILPAAAWLVSAVLVEAAVIDGWKRRVPNWLTYHLAAGGLALAAWTGGAAGLLWSAEGLAVGLAALLPLHAIGGMGAGDVKLMAGVGAWVGPAAALGAFVTSALVGGAIGLAMMIWSGDLPGHLARAYVIGQEVLTVRNPVALSRIAAGRKPAMLLLPYGIPLAIGSIAYFAWDGLLT